MSTSVYILKFSNRIKIGRTCNVEKRIRTIENASGEKCVDSFAINTDGTIEKIMHKELKNHRTVGEYFEYPFEKAKEILIKIADTKIKTSSDEQLLSVRNEIKSYISKSGWTMTDIVKEFNNRHPDEPPTTTQNISNKLSRGTIKYSEVREIADIIGFKIEWATK